MDLVIFLFSLSYQISLMTATLPLIWTLVHLMLGPQLLSFSCCAWLLCFSFYLPTMPYVLLISFITVQYMAMPSLSLAMLDTCL